MAGGTYGITVESGITHFSAKNIIPSNITD